MSASPPTFAKRATHAALLSAGLAASVYGIVHLDVTDLMLPQGKTPPGQEKGGHAQFLTVCSLYATTVTQVSGLIAVILGHHSGQVLKRVHTAGLALSLPLELVVSVLFWPLFLFDRGLLVPTVEITDPHNSLKTIAYTPNIPLLPNLCWHLFPSVALLADYLVFNPPFPKRIKTPIMATLATVAYVTWIEYLHGFNGHYPYPLLDVLSPIQRQAMYGVASFLFCLGLKGANALHKKLHPHMWSLAARADAADEQAKAAKRE